MDEGVLKTSSHASFEPTAHDNLLWHWTLFEVRDSTVEEKPVPFWPTTASHSTLSWCHSSVKGTCSCHNLMRTPNREKILLHCTIWVPRKTTPSCLEGRRSACPASAKAPTPSNSILSSPGLPHSAVDNLSTLLRRDFPFAPRLWVSALFPPTSAPELRRRGARPRDSCWPIPTRLSAQDFPIAPSLP